MNGKKYWRFNGSEFIKKAVDYLYEVLEKYDDEIINEKFISDDKKSKFKKLRKNAMALYIGPKRYTYETMKALARALEVDCDDWAEFSQNPYSKLEDIALRLAISNTTDTNLVCVCFVCDNNLTLTEEFIEDLMYMSSNMFNYRELNDIHVNAVTSVLDKGHLFRASDNKAFAKLYGDNVAKVTTKVSFKYMNVFTLSDRFLNRHKLLIDRDTTKLLDSYQNTNEYTTQVNF